METPDAKSASAPLRVKISSVDTTTFVAFRGENASGTTYQSAGGAPVETSSPLGYSVGWLSIMFLNINMMIGTGIFSTPANILQATGSVGLALVYWTLGTVMAVVGFGVYLELASYFPNRSGSTVVYLEQAYPRPRYLLPVAYAVQCVLLSFTSANAIVLSQYIWQVAGKTPTAWQMKGVGVASHTLAVMCVILHNKYCLWAANIFGAIKILTLLFITITGFVVLGGHAPRVADPGANFRNAFAGTTSNGNDLATALISIIFTYGGYWNAFNVSNEIRDPVRSIKRHGFLAVAIVSVLYVLCNVAYFAAVDKAVFQESKEIAASVFFAAVFGEGAGAQTALNVLVFLSSFGYLLAALIGQSRMIREIARQGILPCTDLLVSTRPFGTPLAPMVLLWSITIIMILAPPAGDAFQFIVSLQVYPDGMFKLAVVLGVFVIRRRRARENIPRSDFRVPDALLVFFTLVQVFVLVMPWWPPKGGPYAGPFSFWYGTYCLVGIAVILLCGLYYVAWMHLIPNWKGYRIRSEVAVVGDAGVTTHRLIKVPIGELQAWDAEHDAIGNLRSRRSASASVSSDS